MTFKECFVMSCGNNSNNNENKLFILLPRKQELRKKWFAAVNRKFVTKTDIYCCEDHFDLKSDMKNWIEYKTIAKKPFMHENAIPRFFINSPIPDNRKFASQLSDTSRKRKRESLENFTEQRKKLAKRRIDFKDENSGSTTENLSQKKESLPLFAESTIKADNAMQSTSTSSPTWFDIGEQFSMHGTSSPISIELITAVPEYVESPSGSFLSFKEQEVYKSFENSYFDVAELPRGIDKQCQANIRPKYRSVGVNTVKSNKSQTHTVATNTTLQFESSSSRISPSKSSSISTESSDIWMVSSSVGSKSSGSRDSDFDRSLKNDSSAYMNRTKFLLETKSRLYLGIPQDSYFIIALLSKHTSSPVDHILMCLKKIRLNDPNTRLADEFGVTESYVAKMFHKTVPILAQHLKKLIFWQSSNYIKSTLPIPFRFRYSKVQSIIDCFEIEIEIPSDPVKQAITWSQYKKCNTMKYLISATPHGFINFISPGFGGRATDKVMVESSGYLNALPPNTQVMADRGFKQVVSVLSSKNCTLVRPPSVAADQKSTKLEVKESKRIAALRIHIERVIRRLREFHMLKMHSCINHKILYLLDQIILIVCGIINLQHVLIK